MPLDFDDQYRALWEPGNPPPDVFAFLAQCGDLNPAQQLAVLLADQPRRWQTDRALTVEEYLARLPDLAGDPDIKLQLAVGEFQARQNSDTSPAVDEFTARFSDISDVLRSKLSELVSGDDGEKQSKFTATETFISDSTIGDQQIGRYRLIRVLMRTRPERIPGALTGLSRPRRHRMWLDSAPTASPSVGAQDG